MTTENIALYGATAAGAITVLYAAYLVRWILGQSDGNDKMKEIAAAIQTGAEAYLRRQYSVIAVVAIVVFGILGLALSWKIAAGFLVGAILSAISGFIGMNISVRANIR